MENPTVYTDFVASVIIEDDSFMNETPDEVRVYDLDGNEMKE